MTRTLLLLALVACIATPALGASLYWRAPAGLNLNLETPYNFENGNSPYMNPNVTMVDMSKTERPILMYAAMQKTYNMGYSLKLGNDGGIYFSDDMASLQFADDMPSTGSKVTVTAGQNAYDAREDFENNDNWAINSPSGTISPLPPCDGDSAIFPSGYTYSIRSTASSINVNSITFQDSIFTKVTSTCASWPALQLQISCDKFYYTDANCQSATPPLIDPNTNECFCFTSTPTAAQEQYESQTRHAVTQAYNAELAAAAAVPMTKSFSVTFDAASLGLTAAQIAQSFPSANTALMSNIKMRLATAYATPMSNITVTSTTVPASGATVAVVGTITAATGRLESYPTMPLSFSGADTVTGADPASSLHTAIVDTVLTEVQRQAAEQAKIDQEKALANCTTCQSAAANNILDNIGIFVNATQAAMMLRSGNTDGISSLALMDGSSASDAISLASSYASFAAGLSAADKATFDSALSARAASETSSNALAIQQAASLPYDATMTVEMPLAADESTNKLRVLASPANSDNVASKVAAAVAGFGGIKSADPSSFSFVVQPVSRRRAASGYALQTTFNYTKSCASDQTTAMCAIASGSSDFTSVQNQANVAVKTIRPMCQDKCCTYNIAVNVTCACESHFQPAYDQARKNGFDATAATQQGVTAYMNIFPCDLEMPSDAAGTCDDASDKTTSQAKANSCGTNAELNFQASQSGGSTGGIGMIAAGVAAGIILIAVIAVIVIKKKKSSKAQPEIANAKDRNVVSFENPMYETNVAEIMTPQSYAEAENASEGLYDEPSFAGASSVIKSNPMYASAEGLDKVVDDATYDEVVGGYQPGEEFDFEGEEGGGYLDVGADGYLDVKPDGAGGDENVYDNGDDEYIDQ